MENLLNEGIDWKVFDRLSFTKDNEIHIFRIDSRQYNDIADLDKILSAEELGRAQKFLKKEDIQDYLLRRYYMRIILSIFTDEAAKNIKYQYGINKKPQLSGIHFNLSHSKGIATIAVSPKIVGIDVEYNDLDLDFTELLNVCCSEREIDYIKDQGGTSREFFTVWTRKEAILKATGEGLIDDLKTVAVLGTEEKRAGETFSLRSYHTTGLLISIAHPSPLNGINFWLYP